MKLLIIITSIIFVSSCARKAESPYGFSLPEGDEKRGEQVFLSYSCLSCHSLANYKFETAEKELATKVKLGGELSKVKTYAELVTSVINPSHKIAKGYPLAEVSNSNGESKMRNYNDIMKVSELIDLVSFLQPHYTIKPNTRTEYKVYYP